MSYITNYPLSALIYIVMFFLVWFCSWNADKTKNKYWVYFLIFVLVLMSGLRDYSVGIDTKNYIKYTFIPLEQGNFSYAYGEIGFKLFVLIILKIFGNYTAVFTIISFVIVYLIVTRFWEMSDSFDFSINMILFYSLVYLSIFNTIRQLLAMAIVFWATKFLFSTKYVKFAVFVAVASLFHTAALFSLILIVLHNFTVYNKVTVKQFAFRFGLLAFGGIICILLLQTERIQFYINHYFVSGSGAGGQMAYLKLILIAMFEGFRFVVSNRKSEFGEADVSAKKQIVLCLISYSIFLIIEIFGYHFLYVDRLSEFLFMFEIMYFSIKTDFRVMRQMKFIAAIVLALYTLISVLNINGYGVMPYKMIF